MKKYITKILCFSFLLTLILALKVGDQVELQSFLNGRSSAAFTADSGNIQKVLAKGTKGEVVETKKFPSGNFGIKMKVENGNEKGKTYWVYYNTRAPALKIFDKDKVELKPEGIDQAKKAITTAPVVALKEKDEKDAVAAAAQAAVKVLSVPEKSLGEVVSPKKPDCVPGTVIVPEEDYKESDIVEPFREVNDLKLYEGRKFCGTEKNYETCKRDGKVEAFQLRNKGPNKINKHNEYYIDRTMSFEFPSKARSDMRLIVSDSPDDRTSHATYSIMLFFPRSVLPAVKQVGNELHVTLPNQEVVRYNAETKEVIGGVFEEKPITQDANGKALPAGLKYTGKGVMIRADKSGDLPYGDIETKGGKTAPSTTTATVSKAGFPDCKIPSKDIWYTREDREGNSFIRPELANDKGLDEFIKKRCKFSLY